MDKVKIQCGIGFKDKLNELGYDVKENKLTKMVGYDYCIFINDLEKLRKEIQKFNKKTSFPYYIIGDTEGWIIDTLDRY